MKTQKKYRVLTYFTDKEDREYPYNEGDLYPRDGLDVDPGRIMELSTSANIRGIKLIEEIGTKQTAYSDERNEDEDD